MTNAQVNKVVINLTQHIATDVQAEAGVINLPAEMHDKVKELLTFTYIPHKELLQHRADSIVRLVQEYHGNMCDVNCLEPEETPCHLMIGGAPYFMSTLENTLKNNGIIPLYAFSERASVEHHNADGTVTKKMVFNHLGFVEV